MLRDAYRMTAVFLVAIALCPAVFAQDSAGDPRAAQEDAWPKRVGNGFLADWELSDAGMTDTQGMVARPTASAPAPASQPSTSVGKEATGASLFAPDPWEVKFKVYGWIPSVEGHAGVGGAVSKLDISICDVIEGLDLVEALVPVNLEARWGRWGVYVDLLYAKVEDEFRKGPAGGVKVNVEADQTILELAGFYRVGTWPCSPSGDKYFTLDLLGGARYNRLSGAIGLQGANHGVALGRAVDWWDPFVGPRINWRPVDKLDLFARADVGGFGLEHSSHFVWQFIGGADYYFTKNFFVELGYRLLDTDFESGSGKGRFTYDIQMAGPYFALGLKF
jgi:opacity protein-like surface antigen